MYYHRLLLLPVKIGGERSLQTLQNHRNIRCLQGQMRLQR